MRSIVVAAALAVVSSFAVAQVATQWIESPEAYFATQLERVEWTRLTSDAERAQFVGRYWLRRDPTPATPKNEFREAIEGRIRIADEKFPFKTTRGSATSRGFAWVVFGPPARFRSSVAPPPPAPRPPALGGTLEPVGNVEAGESYETWTYDRQRTPRVLEMVGLPTLQFDFVIKPQKHTDEMQSPGLAHELRAKLAERSVVQPGAGLAESAPIAAARLDASLAANVARALDDAPPPSLASGGGYFASSTRWSERGEPMVTVWYASASKLRSGATFIGRIRRNDGSGAGTLSEPLHVAPALRSSTGGEVYAMQFALPAGDYNGAFAITDDAGQTIASASLPLHVSDPAKFAASSVVLSATPESATGAGFDIGRLGLVPRADQTFSRSESLWYAGEVVNPTDPKTVAIEVRLRSGAKMLGASQIALEPEASGSRRYFFARELPLAGFEPGDYSMYVVIRDASGAQEVRRADFRIIP
jgi:GWxTD domain-containing protein